MLFTITNLIFNFVINVSKLHMWLIQNVLITLRMIIRISVVAAYFQNIILISEFQVFKLHSPRMCPPVFLPWRRLHNECLVKLSTFFHTGYNVMTLSSEAFMFIEKCMFVFIHVTFKLSFEHQICVFRTFQWLKNNI